MTVSVVIMAAKAKFQLDINGVHGIAHWSRVASVGRQLANLTGANQRVVELFAYQHDACREDEWDDPEHGQRAADWAHTMWMDGLIDITTDEVLLLANAIKGHDAGRLSDDPTIGTCWDADRADLGRVGMQPAARFISTAPAKAMLFGDFRENRND